MHATDVLAAYPGRSCQAFRKARWKTLGDAIEALLKGRQLSVTDLGRTLGVGGLEKHASRQRIG